MIGPCMPPRRALSYVAYEMPATCPWHEAHRSFNKRPIDPFHDKSGGRVGAGVGVGRRGAAAQPLTISALSSNRETIHSLNFI
jgi:hypothetical protein